MKLSNQKILTLIATGFLFVALFDGLPYGFFTLLRFVVCVVGAYIAYKTYEKENDSLWVWLFGGIAVLFNPIIPISFERETWWFIDLIVGVLFLFSIFLINNKENYVEIIKKFCAWKEKTSILKATFYFFSIVILLFFIILIFK